MARPGAEVREAELLERAPLVPLLLAHAALPRSPGFST